MDQTNYSGKYFRTSYGDIKSSKGWFGKICLLGLISFIPIFGQMTLYGYAYEWAHKAAWGVNTPMPKKIYGRPGSKMLRWGWFALVIAVVFTIVPSIIMSIGSWASGAGMETGIYTATGRYMVVTPGNFALTGLGWVINVAGIVLTVFACLFMWAGIMRMTMYDRLGPGFQFGKLWAMIKQDFGGIMRIFGMMLLFSLVGGFIIGIVTLIIVVLILGTTIAPIILMAQNGYSDSAMVGYVLTLIVTLFPLLLIMSYVAFVYNAFVELLVARALGYWMRQFNVAAWGTKDDPLPFEVAGGQPDAPHPPHGPGQDGDMPAPPAGEPVSTAAPQAAAPEAPVEVPPALNPVDVAEALDAEPELPAAEPEQPIDEQPAEVTEVEVEIDADDKSADSRQ